MRSMKSARSVARPKRPIEMLFSGVQNARTFTIASAMVLQQSKDYLPHLRMSITALPVTDRKRISGQHWLRTYTQLWRKMHQSEARSGQGLIVSEPALEMKMGQTN